MSKPSNNRPQAAIEATTSPCVKASHPTCDVSVSSREMQQTAPSTEGVTVTAGKASAPKVDPHVWVWWWGIPVALLLLSISLQAAIIMDMKPQSYLRLHRALEGTGRWPAMGGPSTALISLDPE